MTESINTYRIEVRARSAFRNEAEALAALHQLGVTQVERCWRTNLYFVQGAFTLAEAAALAQRLVTDPVTEEAETRSQDAEAASDPGAEHNYSIEVTLLPGVTDPVAENLVRSAHLLGFSGVERAATGQRYHLVGEISAAELARLATQVFANPVIQRAVVDQRITPPFVPVLHIDDTVEEVTLCAADEQGLLQVSSARRLALDLAEMQAIQRYFQQEEREPTDAEIETLAQTWSEHCVHKTFRAKIICRDASNDTPATDENRKSKIENPKSIDGLLRTYIRAATEEVNKPWVRSAFVDNAGVIAFDEQWDLAFKVETHNHPSALEPFGGAHTGVGGVVRDILGISAKPIANTDVLCFGPPDLPAEQLPAGVLHPQRIAAGVTHGIEDYGNKLGIPTVNGAILYHPGYTSNPLVFCGSLGLLPRDSHPTATQAGDLIVVIGGRTGRDGLRGATFSSMEMDHTTSLIAGSAVQIGHPIMEKQVLEVVLQARDQRLYHAITDCGAGGLASAVGEMGSKLGATVDLATVPLKYPGLRPWEIWLSEAQERMVLAVPPASWPQFQAICVGQNVEAVAIGTFIDSGRLTLTYGSKLVADLSMHFLHEGIPQRLMTADLPPITPDGAPPLPAAPPASDLTAALLALLAHPDIRSKEAVIRRYDHEVQGATAVKPLVGIANHGPSDAAVIAPLFTLARPQIAQIDTDGNPLLAPPNLGEEQSVPKRETSSLPSQGRAREGLAAVKAASLSAGICPRYGVHDPYRMAWAAVDEALRNAVCVGADPDQVALLDNFCWGKPTLPDRLGSLVRCAQGCYDAAVAYQAPFISGKDSLNNEYLGADGRYHAIPGTLLISALGLVPDVQQAMTMDGKAAGNLLYLIGVTRNEIGGSHYQEWYSQSTGHELAGVVPQPIREPLPRLRALHRAIRQGLVQACHDCSEGGLAVAVAEMALAGRLGAEIDLRRLVTEGERRNDLLLFAESLGRFVVEVRPADQAAFEKELADIPFAHIGQLDDTHLLRISGLNGEPVIHTEVNQLERAWRGQLLVSAEPVTESPGHLATLTRQAQSSSQPVTQSAIRVLILHANGTNRDHDVALACELVGARPEIVHINQLLAGERRLRDYGMVVLPGGFSYGDDLGAGALWALQLHQRLGDDLTHFAESGRPLLGICNGFQALVKTGLLPGGHGTDPTHRRATLTYNASGHFECRWVYLQPNPTSPCIFTQGLAEPIYCPVAHGEGRFAADLALTASSELIALRYVTADGAPATYPANPNGSLLEIAGICNPAGNILGLMPHPEDHILPWQHPRWSRGERGLTGLELFAQGVRYAQ